VPCCSSRERQAAGIEEEKASPTGAESYILDRPLIQYAVALQKLASGNARLVEVVANTRPTLKKQVSFVAARDAVAPLSERQKLMSDALIRQFVPVPVVEELNGVTGLSYFAEIREVVTMFMKVRLITTCVSCFAQPPDEFLFVPFLIVGLVRRCGQAP
jgi:hypothetical protein